MPCLSVTARRGTLIITLSTWTLIVDETHAICQRVTIIHIVLRQPCSWSSLRLSTEIFHDDKRNNGPFAVVIKDFASIPLHEKLSCGTGKAEY